MVLLLSSVALKPEELSAIGQVAVESSYCQHIIEEAIWALCALDDDGQRKALTVNMPFEKQLDLLRDLWRPILDTAEKRQRLTDLATALKEANTDRNTIIHGYWKPPSVSLADLMRGAPFPPAISIRRHKKTVPFRADRILTTAEKIATLAQELDKFLQSEGLREP